MVQIEVRVAAHPHQLARFVAGLLRDHPCQQRRAEQVERQAQRDIAAALVEHAGDPVAGDVELVGLVARRQRHPVELGDVPALDDVPTAAGIGAQALDHLGHLVDAGARPKQPVARRLVGRPVDPLLAVDRAEIAPLGGEIGVLDDAPLEILLRDILARGLAVFLERPVAPDRHALFEQRADVGLAGQEPQHLARRGLPEHALGGQQRHAAFARGRSAAGCRTASGCRRRCGRSARRPRSRCAA